MSERETILKLRTLVQTKNTKLDQLKNKLVEVDATSKARLQLLNIERGEKQVSVLFESPTYDADFLFSSNFSETSRHN